MKNKIYLSKNLLSVAVFTLLFVNKATATQYVQIPLEKIIDSAPIIIEGTIIETKSFLGIDGNIYTANILEINNVLRSGGKISCGEAEIITEGGQLGSIGTYIPGGLSFGIG